MKYNTDIINQSPEILEQAIYNNGYSVFLPWSKSIGFKTQTLKFQEQKVLPSIAEDFIINLGFSRNDIESESTTGSYLSSMGTVMLSFSNQEENSSFKKIKLPKSISLKIPLGDVINSRRSVRQFTGDNIALNFLSTIIKAGCGVTATNNITSEDGTLASLSFKAVASAGGIYPVDMYIAALNIENLERAIYQYNSKEDCLIKLYDENIVTKLLECFSISDDQISITRSGFICLMVGCAPKSMFKYGTQGVSFTIHEIGSISQNVHLAVNSLGLGSVDCASYFINEAHKVLKFDGIYKHLFHTIIVGVSQ